VQALKEGGYQGEDLEKITYRNWLRILNERLGAGEYPDRL
jgi:microsomal dipeptidase-like Zn-dependent dipeptidase